MGDPAIVGNQNWNSGKSPGFLVYFQGNFIGFNVGDGSNRMKERPTLPYDYQAAWTHVLVSADREANVVKISYNFEEFVVYNIPAGLQDDNFDNPTGSFNIGHDGSGAYGSKLKATMDEFMVFDGVFTDEDLAALEQYYGITE